jgi:4-amino-4-deoxy-L-arabinose transferase-like glycosyltransferase
MRRISFRNAALLLALAGALHGLVYIRYVDIHAPTDSWTYRAAGNAILDGSYSTPLKAGFYFDYPRGWFDITGRQFDPSVWPVPEPQVFRPPGYPAYLALVGGGDPGASERLALAGQALLFAVGVFLLALIGRRVGGERLGLLAGALYALDPWSKHYVALLLSEVLAGTLALGAAYAFVRAWQERSTAWWGVSGVLVAALTLTRAVFVFAVPLLLLAAALRGRGRALLAPGAAAAVLLVPWLAWTTSVLGKPAMASYGEGFNLLVAAHGEGHGRSFQEVITDPAFRRDFVAAQRTAPTPAEIAADRDAHPRYVSRADEEQRAQAWSLLGDRLRDQPLQVSWETLYRVWFLWNAHLDWYQPSGAWLVALQALDWVVLAFAAAGAVLAIRRRGPGAALAVLLLVYSLVIGTHHVEARFAMPLRGLLLLFASLALLALADRLRREHRDEERGDPGRGGGGAPDGREERLRDGEDERGDTDAGGRSRDAPPLGAA